MSTPSLRHSLDSTWSYGELLASLGPQSVTLDRHPDEGALECFDSASASAAWATPSYTQDSPLMLSDSPASINFEPTMGTYTVDPNDTALSPMWQMRRTPPTGDAAGRQSAESTRLVHSKAAKRKSSSGGLTDSLQASPTKKTSSSKKSNISLRTSRPKRKGKYADSETGGSSSLGPLNSANGDSILPTPLNEDVSMELHLARRTHNHVEKRYRTRLNLQFERLLAVLPSTDLATDDSRLDGQPTQNNTSEKLDKHVSKAEVLQMARQRIRTLERENQQLRQEFASYDQMYSGACGGVPDPYGPSQQTPQYQHATTMA